nr:unnamed protein product [Digitaria exilis]
MASTGSPTPRGVEGHVFSEATKVYGIREFMAWKDLARSGCVKDDAFTVRCDITVFQDWTKVDDDTSGGGAATPATPRVVVPPSNLREHMNDLLWKKKGADVTIHVGEESFDAHGWLLMARSPVFEAELIAAPASKEKLSGGVGRRVEIKGVEPKVFKAMLHFMYTDALPETMEEEEEEEEEETVVAMAQGLLAAANRFKLERLKVMCEEILCRHIDVSSVAVTLAVAEENGCHALKAACLEFIARPGNMKKVMETEGFEKTKDSCLAAMLDVAMKQLAS